MRRPAANIKGHARFTLSLAEPDRFSDNSRTHSASSLNLSDSAQSSSPLARPHRKPARLTTMLPRPCLPGSPPHMPPLLRLRQFLLRAHKHPPESVATAGTVLHPRPAESTSLES